MQVHFTIDQGYSRITLELMGTPRPGELQAFARAIASRIDFKAGMQALIDARELEALPTMGELALLVNDFRRLRGAGTIGRTAVVMERALSERLANVFRLQVGGTEPPIAAFTTPTSATEWLEVGATWVPAKTGD